MATTSTLSTSVALTYNKYTTNKIKRTTTSEDYFKEKDLNAVIQSKLSFIGKKNYEGSSFVSAGMLNELNGKHSYYNQTPFSIREGMPSSNHLNHINDEREDNQEHHLHNLFPIDNIEHKIKTRIMKTKINKLSNTNISVSNSVKSINSKINRSNNKNTSRSKSKAKNVAKKHQAIRRAETNRQVDLNKYSYVFDDVDSSIQSSRLNYKVKPFSKTSDMGLGLKGLKIEKIEKFDTLEKINDNVNDFANLNKKVMKYHNKNLKTLHKNINFRRKDELD